MSRFCTSNKHQYEPVNLMLSEARHGGLGQLALAYAKSLHKGFHRYRDDKKACPSWGLRFLILEGLEVHRRYCRTLDLVTSSCNQQ